MHKKDKTDFNWNNWSGKKISQFLVEEYLEHRERYDIKNTREVIIDNVSKKNQKYKKYDIFLGFLDKIFLRLLLNNFNKKQKFFLFQSIKYPSIILATKKYCASGLIAVGKKDRVFSFKNFIGYLSVTDLNKHIYAYLTCKNVDFLFELLKEIEQRLKNINPDFIVLWNDSLPIERAIVLVSKKLGIATIIIQHGICRSDISIFDGRVADYVLLWGEYFKDLYIKKGVKKAEEIYILGYPYSIKKDDLIHKTKRTKRRYVVCYLGGGFSKRNESLLNIELVAIINLYVICNRLNLKFIYRPHPSDDRELLKNKLHNIHFVSKREKISKTIKKGDIFISLNSTSLVEAAMRSKVCLQLMDRSFKTDEFEKLGVCTKSFKSTEEIENYLRKIKDSSNLDNFKVKFNNNYVNLSYNPGQRFLEIIKDIEKKNNKNNEKE